MCGCGASVIVKVNAGPVKPARNHNRGHRSMGPELKLIICGKYPGSIDPNPKQEHSQEDGSRTFALGHECREAELVRRVWKFDELNQALEGMRMNAKKPAIASSA